MRRWWYGASPVTLLPSFMRSSIRFRWIATGFLVLLALGLALAYVVYDRYVAYQSTVARHVPPDALAAARFDLTHVMIYEPFRASIFPLVDRLAAGTRDEPRRAALEARGIRVASDVREVLLALGPGAGDWLLAVGGRLPATGVGATLASVLRDEGQRVEEHEGRFWLPAHGVAFAQASDGAVVLASDEERLRSALAVRPARQELTAGAGGFTIGEPWLIRPLQHLTGTLRAGSVIAIEGRAQFPAAEEALAAELAVRTLLERAGSLDPALVAAFRPSALRAGEGEVQLQLGLPATAMERIAGLVSRSLIGVQEP